MTLKEYKKDPFKYDTIYGGYSKAMKIRSHAFSCLNLAGKFRRNGDKEMAKIMIHMSMSWKEI